MHYNPLVCIYPFFNHYSWLCILLSYLLPSVTDGINPTIRVEVGTVLNTTTGRVCREGFYINETTGLCSPECGVWEEFPHGFIVGIDSVAILTAVINLLGSTVILVLSCISYKRM